jgi:hypothetical protein
MKQGLAFVTRALLTGFLIVVPIYLTVLLLLKAMKSVVGLVRPVALLLPDSLPAETLLSLLLVLVLCLLIGMIVRTRAGGVVQQRLEKSLFERIPGSALIRSLTQQLAGSSQEKVWQPAFFESDEGLLRLLSLKSLRMGAIRSLFRRSQLRLQGRSTFRTGNAFIPWTCLSLTLLELSPSGGRGPGN